MSEHDDTQQSRRDCKPVKVYCLRDEMAVITANAARTGLSSSTFLRRLGMGFEPRSVFDLDQVDRMSKINADLARLGNLLKMWLADDARLKQFDEAQMRATILVAMDRIKECQTALLEAANKA